MYVDRMPLRLSAESDVGKVEPKTGSCDRRNGAALNIRYVFLFSFSCLLRWYTEIFVI